MSSCVFLYMLTSAGACLSLCVFSYMLTSAGACVFSCVFFFLFMHTSVDLFVLWGGNVC